jgi:hypothetical protein
MGRNLPTHVTGAARGPGPLGCLMVREPMRRVGESKTWLDGWLQNAHVKYID